MSWAYDHSDPKNIKYSTNSHAVYITASGTLLFLISFLLIRYTFFDYSNSSLHWLSPYVSGFFILYLILMVSTRYYENGNPAIYEFLWACNECMLMAAIGLYLGDEELVRVSLISVSLDQLLWYIDMLSFTVKRKFVIGVAKYIIWPESAS